MVLLACVAPFPGDCPAQVDPEALGECVTAAMRSANSVDGATCDRIPPGRWREECHFVIAENRAARGDRWGALAACGNAGDFLQECLYHSWTRELQAVILADPKAPLTDVLSAARDRVAYWGQLETAGPDQGARVWGDFWYFWWLHHRPASLSACDALPPADRDPCRVGTAAFVERALTDRLRCEGEDCDLMDRICRGGSVPASLLAILTTDPQLSDAAERARARVCDPQTRGVRPWNPIFQPRPRL